MNSVLVTGGAGYIGSHMVQALGRSGYRVLVLDNLTAGHQTATQGADLVQEDLSDRAVLRALLLRHRPSAICHFAASCRVDDGEIPPGSAGGIQHGPAPRARLDQPLHESAISPCDRIAVEIVVQRGLRIVCSPDCGPALGHPRCSVHAVTRGTICNNRPAPPLRMDAWPARARSGTVNVTVFAVELSCATVVMKGTPFAAIASSTIWVLPS